MVTTVIFDLDDTLYDEIEYCKSGFTAVANWLSEKFKLDGGIVFEDLWNEFQNGDRSRVFNEVLDKHQIDYSGNLIPEIIRVYREHKPDIILPDDSRTILEDLSKNYKLGLVSDGYLPAQRYKFEALGLEGYFQAVVFTEDLGREFWKPSEKGFKIACKELVSGYEQSVYVADNAKKDFIAPNRLGFAASIQLIRENKVHVFDPPGEDYKPTHIINSLGELEGIIEML